MTRVKNFAYDGFMGQIKPGLAPYEATFVRWTADPGVALCKCSDGKERLIPSFAFEDKVETPEQPNTGVLFGEPCNS